MLFLALLAVAAQIAVGAAALLTLAGHLPGVGQLAPVLGIRRAVVADLAPAAVAMASVVAVVATLGSLYLSEVAHFVPCRLCWYQRAAMYPLGPALALLALRWRRAGATAALVVAAVGATISTYHVILERYPTLESSICEPTNPCTLIWVRRFGYLTIPGMALSGFLLVITLLVVARSAPRR